MSVSAPPPPSRLSAPSPPASRLSRVEPLTQAPWPPEIDTFSIRLSVSSLLSPSMRSVPASRSMRAMGEPAAPLMKTSLSVSKPPSSWLLPRPSVRSTSWPKLPRSTSLPAPVVRVSSPKLASIVSLPMPAARSSAPLVPKIRSFSLTEKPGKVE